jgi:predicted DNA repair protein MutK
MSSGLLALLDDVASLAKVAAASIDDVAAQAGKAGAKAAGIVIDDAAVTPRYVVGFAAERELPIIGKIALGSLKNKILFLLPGALVLSYFAPWTITPLLMLGGLYLCYEGAEKVLEPWLHHGHVDNAPAAEVIDAEAFENEKVAGAIATDFILSAEIMAIALSTVASSSFATQAAVLAVVGLGLTVIVYGAVALIVKADDLGVALAKDHRGALSRLFGRALVKGMPYFLKALSIVGTAAMIWVGGGILLHGAETLGFAGPAHWAHGVAAAVGKGAGAFSGFVTWAVDAALSGVLGLIVGAALIPVVGVARKFVPRRARPAH